MKMMSESSMAVGMLVGMFSGVFYGTGYSIAYVPYGKQAVLLSYGSFALGRDHNGYAAGRQG